MSSGESQSLGHRVVVQLDPVLIQRCRRCRWLEMRAVRIWRSAGRGRHRGRCDGSRGRQLRIAAAARFRLEGEVERRRRCQLRRHPGSWRLGTTHDTQTVGNNVMKNSGPFHFRAGARRERERAVGLSTSNEGIQHPAAANSIFICLCVCVSLADGRARPRVACCLSTDGRIGRWRRRLRPRSPSSHPSHWLRLLHIHPSALLLQELLPPPTQLLPPSIIVCWRFSHKQNTAQGERKWGK